MDQKGRKAKQMVLNIDLAPTLLEMAGVPVPEVMEGESFLPALRSSGANGRKAWLYEYFKDFPYRAPTMHAVRTDTHIYIEYQEGKKPELYNITNDPRQLDNLINKPEKKPLVEEMKRMLRDLKKGHPG
jgi:N-acetylglucosamine-6-sulfatase